ncbi:MAG: DUF3568 family protein [Verrucomicrobia bacterium]|nr:DUF3568 family protein [Verrucomicrobiota bacterium]MBI3870402.1 DUF3568 family protein [Verrucomicrobiota bacterium]
MKFITHAYCLALCLMLLSVAGCASIALIGAGAAAGVAGVAYANGELKTSLEASLDNAYAAAQAAMKDFQFSIKKTAKDVLYAKVEATTAQDKSVQITLNKTSDKITELRIRVGVFGDESLSRSIHEKIKARL